MRCDPGSHIILASSSLYIAKDLGTEGDGSGHKNDAKREKNGSPIEEGGAIHVRAGASRAIGWGAVCRRDRLPQCRTLSAK